MQHPFKTLLGTIASACVFAGNLAVGGIPVVTYHYDNGNIGVNSAETLLTPSDLTTSTFQKLYSVTLDPQNPQSSQTFTEPLYVPGVTVTNGANAGKHDLVMVGTQADVLYAIDAASGVIVWETSFLLSGLPGATTITPVPASDSEDNYNATPTTGILGTPVIDSTTNLLYVLVKTKQIINGATATPSFVNTLYKIDITTGNIIGHDDYAVTIYDGTTYTFRTNPDPSVAQDPFVPGSGDGYTVVNGQNRVYFNALRELHRMALILANGNVYACFASAVGVNPYHGWILGFDKGTLAVTSALNLTPNGERGGIWASGGHPAVDSSGNIFLALGNGTFDGNVANGLDPVTDMPINGDYGDCLVKLAVDTTTTPANQTVNGWGMKVVDYFTPSKNAALESGDLDLGSGGILLLPDSYGSTAHPHLIVTTGKEGTIYLLDRDSLGKFYSTDKSVQELLAPALLQCFDTPSFFNGTLYYAAENDNGKAFSIANGVISTTPVETPDTFGLRGSTPTISANGTTHGVVWTLNSPYQAPGQLRAYSAANFATEIWTSDQAANSRDAVGTGVRFSVPTVADGRVFVGTQTALIAYGLNPAVAVFTSDPPNVTVAAGAPYSFTFTASGTPPPTFTFTSGALPPGLTLSSTGLLSGTPTTPGTYSAAVTASSSGLASSTQSFTITITSSAVVTLNNPVAYWQFNEGTGTITADSSGNGAIGTLNSTPAWVTGMFGDALNFNGSSSYVSFNNASVTSPLKPPLPVTISAWVKPTNTTGVQQVFSSDNWNTRYAGYALQINGGQLNCGYGSGGGVSASNRRSKGGKTIMAAGQWYFVTAVIQGPTTMSLYINGVDDGGTYSGTGGTMGYTTTPSEIGKTGTIYPYNGVIDDLRVYNRALSPIEVGLLANGPISNWRFDEGSGTIALDSGTAGITGSLINSPIPTQGMFGNALNFNGSNSYVSFNNASVTSPLKPPLPVTISAWVKPTNTTGVQQIFSSDNWNTRYAGYALQINGGQLNCGYGSGGGVSASNRRSKGGKTIMAAGQWYFVTAVIQGPTTMSLYINGVDDGSTYSGTGGTMGYTTTPSEIGKTGTIYPYNGVIDDLRVYNRALSPAEVQTLSSANSGPIAPE